MTAIEVRPAALPLAPVDFDRDQLDLIKTQIAPGASDGELNLFVQQCKRTGLEYLASQTWYNPKQLSPGVTANHPERGPFREGQMDISKKVCRDCGGTFPATLEFFHSRGKGNLNTYCKACATARAKAHHEANRERKLRLMAEYRAENREAINSHIRELRAKNPEKKRALDAAYYETNAPQLRLKAKLYYRANRPAFIARARNWAARNPEKAAAHTRAKNHRRRGAAMDDTARQYAAILTNDPCCYCGSYEGGVEIDHIMPIASGGTGDWANLTRACRNCNGAKTDKSLMVFLMERAL